MDGNVLTGGLWAEAWNLEARVASASLTKALLAQEFHSPRSAVTPQATPVQRRPGSCRAGIIRGIALVHNTTTGAAGRYA